MADQPARLRGSAQWWVTDGDGVRLRIDAGGVLIGRSPNCEVVLRDPKASRAHALMYLDGDRPRLLVLGQGRTRVNDEIAAREAALGAGDRVVVPGGELVIEALGNAAPPEAQAWVLERPGGGLFGVTYGPFFVGGHDADDLHLDGWPPHALALHPTQGRLHLAAQVELEVDGAAVAPGGLLALAAGSLIACAGQRLRVVAMGQLDQDTILSGDGAPEPPPQRIAFEFLPRGGRLRVATASGERAVYLPGQRCDLLALLLHPPEPHRVGDMLDDDYLIERLWPNQSRTRADLNTLIYRLRKDLVGAGLDATALLVRAPGGGGTRLNLAPDVAIAVR